MTITGTAETEIRKQQFEREQGAKATVRDTRKQLENVVITGTAETEIRKQQFDREKGEKATVRDTKKNLSDVNMAVAVV